MELPMTRQCESLKVFVSTAGFVCLQQDCDNMIIIHPDQIELVVRWILECGTEAQAMEKD